MFGDKIHGYGFVCVGFIKVERYPIYEKESQNAIHI